MATTYGTKHRGDERRRNEDETPTAAFPTPPMRWPALSEEKRMKEAARRGDGIRPIDPNGETRAEGEKVV